jgi:hypothetical protein
MSGTMEGHTNITFLAANTTYSRGRTELAQTMLQNFKKRVLQFEYNP